MTAIPHSPATDRIRRFSRPCVHLLTGIGAILILGVTAVALAVLLQQGPATVSLWQISFHGASSYPVTVPLAGLDLTARGLVALILIAVAIPLVLIVWNMRRLFLLYARGIVFSRENIGFIRAIAWLLIVYPVARSLGETLMQLTATGAIVHFYFEIGSLFFGIGALFIAHVMDLGCELLNEQAQFL